MAQAARRPASAEPPPPRDRLRVVPAPARRTARRPPPEVIRRRRIVALGGLTGLIGLPLALVAFSGGPATAHGEISALLTTGASEPRTLCAHLSAGMLRAVGGQVACMAASPARGPGAEVRDVRVDGSVATAVVVKPDGNERVRLVREDGGWKVDDVS